MNIFIIILQTGALTALLITLMNTASPLMVLAVILTAASLLSNCTLEVIKWMEKRKNARRTYGMKKRDT